MISVAVFTLDEEVNLPHCLNSLEGCDDVVVVDSGSQDRTCRIAEERGCRVFYHPFQGFGKQRNWAFEHISFRHPWVLVLDADERMTPSLWKEMVEKVTDCSAEISAFRMKRRFFWNGVWLRRASLYPTWVVRLIRLGRVRYINRGHAETQNVEGKTGFLTEDLIDENHKGYEAWKLRQEKYAWQEAEYEAEKVEVASLMNLFSSQPLKRRECLKSWGRQLPFRGFFYFIYVYFMRNGWLDGREGLRFCLEKAYFQQKIREISLKIKKERAKV